MDNLLRTTKNRIVGDSIDVLGFLT